MVNSQNTSWNIISWSDIAPLAKQTDLFGPWIVDNRVDNRSHRSHHLV